MLDFLKNWFTNKSKQQKYQATPIHLDHQQKREIVLRQLKQARVSNSLYVSQWETETGQALLFAEREELLELLLLINGGSGKTILDNLLQRNESLAFWLEIVQEYHTKRKEIGFKLDEFLFTLIVLTCKKSGEPVPESVDILLNLNYSFEAEPGLDDKRLLVEDTLAAFAYFPSDRLRKVVKTEMIKPNWWRYVPAAIF
ncbi:MAG: hypothetical protein AAF518_21620 [Spirochaetota bacterium]